MRRALTDSERDGINAALALSDPQYLFWIMAERCKRCGASMYCWQTVGGPPHRPFDTWCPWWCAHASDSFPDVYSTIQLMRRMIDALNDDA